ncbi:MAG: leucine-rich repeat protein [Lachnospiraceae bacterium]|nr:leucine-rich repeat protein [Lachnospiraceae bacterium]
MADGSINNTAYMAAVYSPGNTNGTSGTGIIDSNSNTFISEEGIIYKSIEGTNECQVVSYTGNNRNVIIPDEYNGHIVTSVAAGAFRGNEIITSIIIGRNIKSIGGSAFSHCGYLENAEFKSNKIKAIPPNCFEACESLKKLELPESVKKAGYRAFAFCTSMYQIIIPGQVTSFGKEIFYGCNKNRLTIVTEKGNKAEKTALEYGMLVTNTSQTALSANRLADIEGAQDKIYVYSAPSRVKWKSLDPGIASVNQHGRITALKPGTATVTARTAGIALKCKIKVYKRNKKNCLKIIYSKYVKKEMTDYEKIYAAHAWLIQNVKYDKTLYETGTVPAISHTAEGAFNRGIAVCDGYSKAFIIIMEHYGIKSQMITGGAHAWNIVKIKNKWYHIDCTYDDPVVNGSFNNRNVFLDFFLKTDKEMRITHIWDYSAFPKCNSKTVNKKYKTV